MYGVLCGKHNNLIVIDYDIHKLEETSINLQSLKGVHGSSAYIVKTQSGGFHGFHVYHTYEDKFDSWPDTCGIRLASLLKRRTASDVLFFLRRSLPSLTARPCARLFPPPTAPARPRGRSGPRARRRPPARDRGGRAR